MTELNAPKGKHPCSRCKGKGSLSMYDSGWNSFLHDPKLAAPVACWVCKGEGFIDDRR